jgi:hypothetical protein
MSARLTPRGEIGVVGDDMSPGAWRAPLSAGTVWCLLLRLRLTCVRAGP